MGSMMIYDGLETFGPDTTLELHLSSNFYPPLPEAAREWARAIYTRIKRGDYQPNETLPGVTTQSGEPVVAADLVRAYHLEPFIEWFSVPHSGDDAEEPWSEHGPSAYWF